MTKYRLCLQKGKLLIFDCWYMIACTNYFAILNCRIVLLPNCISFQYTIWQFSILIFYTFEQSFGGGLPQGWVGVFSDKEGGIQVLACQAPSIQTVESLLRTPWRAKLAGTIVESYINEIWFFNFFPTIIIIMFSNFTRWQLSPNFFEPGIVL